MIGETRAVINSFFFGYFRTAIPRYLYAFYESLRRKYVSVVEDGIVASRVSCISFFTPGSIVGNFVRFRAWVLIDN